jgi:uncharacterized protein YdiU (UPF0061 family)
LVAFSPEVARQLEISDEDILSAKFASVFGGNEVLPGMQPYAACYGGHQFGTWAGQLGDGRAIGLGEIKTASGRFELQLKGAGPTPYSRSADGRAVLRSSLREFLCSEAMHHLGIPTTRALSLVTTGERVIRDMLYDGNPKPEPGAIVCRVAPSFIRFGNFEILAARQDHALLKRLVDFTIDRDFPEISGLPGDRPIAWFHNVCQRTAELVAHWMRVGFVHGVLNTDNMSIMGLTIDYGPYGWIDNFDRNWTPNTTDYARRRYAFGRQPQIALWNLACLANALQTIIPSVSELEYGLNIYRRTFASLNERFNHEKFGFVRQDAMSQALIEQAFDLLETCEADMTTFFRALGSMTANNANLDLINKCIYDPKRADATATAWTDWLASYRKRLEDEGSVDQQRQSLMNAVNPSFVLRNYLAQLAIDKAEEGDFTLVEQLMTAMREPYRANFEHSDFLQLRPDWAKSKPGCSMLSCSS